MIGLIVWSHRKPSPCTVFFLLPHESSYKNRTTLSQRVCALSFYFIYIYFVCCTIFFRETYISSRSGFLLWHFWFFNKEVLVMSLLPFSILKIILVLPCYHQQITQKYAFLVFVKGWIQYSLMWNSQSLFYAGSDCNMQFVFGNDFSVDVYQ